MTMPVTEPGAQLLDQRSRDISDNRADTWERKQWLPFEQRRESLSFDQFHDNVGKLVDAEVINGHGVGILQSAGNAGFSTKALKVRFIMGKVRM